ncbi:hypothetical protein BCR44DRAFT_1050993 [Catenaria anguillulae PL171]|uniref:Uncharacterized protein n=1 Tax=Catenaria anguillulae PL171 TaxID=765915 RepID=A0A1Y2HR23_9FUNG|nr:hypothetical protein BCR44DRAFT_1050993 [Catenaria anguillulae PL171]
MSSSSSPSSPTSPPFGRNQHGLGASWDTNPDPENTNAAPSPSPSQPLLPVAMPRISPPAQPPIPTQLSPQTIFVPGLLPPLPSSPASSATASTIRPMLPPSVNNTPPPPANTQPQPILPITTTTQTAPAEASADPRVPPIPPTRAQRLRATSIQATLIRNQRAACPFGRGAAVWQRVVSFRLGTVATSQSRSCQVLDTRPISQWDGRPCTSHQPVWLLPRLSQTTVPACIPSPTGRARLQSHLGWRSCLHLH